MGKFAADNGKEEIEKIFFRHREERKIIQIRISYTTLR